MSLHDEIMKKIPDYYPTMYLDGYSPEQILMAKRRQIREDFQERNNPETPTDIHITSEVKIKK